MCIMQFWRAALVLTLGMNCLPNPGREQKRHADTFLIKSHFRKKKNKNKKKKKICTATAEKKAGCAFGRTEKKPALPPRKSTGSGLQRAAPQPQPQGELIPPSPRPGAGRDALPAGQGSGVPAPLPDADPLSRRVRGRSGPWPPISARREHTHGGAAKKVAQIVS